MVYIISWIWWNSIIGNSIMLMVLLENSILVMGMFEVRFFLELQKMMVILFFLLKFRWWLLKVVSFMMMVSSIVLMISSVISIDIGIWCYRFCIIVLLKVIQIISRMEFWLMNLSQDLLCLIQCLMKGCVIWLVMKGSSN